MRPLRNSFIIVLLFVFFAACQRSYLPQNLIHSGYEIKPPSVADSILQVLLKPYRDSVDAVMNDVVGELTGSLKKDLPDGTLGNFIADAYLNMARARYDQSAQIAFMNHGGIRMNNLAAGRILRGNIYEVMPFDNQMVIMRVSGSILKNYLDAIAKDGGGGVAGVHFVIKEKKATDIQIGGTPLDEKATYVMVNSDYVVNGGGGFTGFRALPLNKPGYLLRDAIIDYCISFSKEGKPVSYSNEKRIRN